VTPSRGDTLMKLNIFVERGGKQKNPYRIVTKFCTGLGAPDVVTHPKFSGHQLMVLGTAWVEFLTFPLISIDFRCRP